MSDVIRVFVEKKPGFDVEAQHIRADLVENLGMKSVTDVKLLNRYDISGMSAEEFAQARDTIFSEPNVDNVYEETYEAPAGYRVFAMEYLPGQYDQRADSAAQCVQLLTQGERPAVATAKVIGLKGQVSAEEFEKVKHYLINPVESREASMEKPATLEMQADVPADVARVTGFTTWDKARMQAYFDSMGFAMTLSDLEFCRDYFRDEEHRDPTVTELRVIDTYWSDHCRHTTFLTRLNKIDVEKGALSQAVEKALRDYLALREELYAGRDKPVSLMDMATIGAKYLRKKGLVPDLDESEEINACSIEAPVTIDGKTETWLIQFKNETHNHPTEIEPFGGAATCLGGAIRDPLSGRSYVYQAMRVTGSGDPTVPFEKTLHGKLPSRKITTGAAAGYSSYGNQIGLATGQVTELYDPGYVAKRMEIGAVVGASPKANVRREAPVPGDVIVLLGGATGRDGIGGATGSSKAHTEKSVEVCGAEVQKGNPPTERKLQRLFRDPSVSTLIKRCNDFGAGGVCVAIGELAPGLKIDLDKVPKKYDGLDGTELAICESQERMAVVLDSEDVKKFIRLAGEENLEATPVAYVTEEPVLRMFWRGDEIVHITRAFLDTNGVTQKADALITAADPADDYRTAVPAELKGIKGLEAIKRNLARLTVCSQKGLSERFDSSIGAATVLMPFAGRTQLTPENVMAAAIPTEQGAADTATVMSYGFIPGISKFSPFHGAAYAVVQSLVKLAASGADSRKAYLTFQEFFEKLRSEPERWGKPFAALLGALKAQLDFGRAAIGGKDSMSGSFLDKDVPPTLISFAIAPIKAGEVLSPEFKEAGHPVYRFAPENDSAQALKTAWEAFYDLHRQGKVKAAWAVENSLAEAVMKMSFGNSIGFQTGLEDVNWYAPCAGAIVAELTEEINLDCARRIGETTEAPFVALPGDAVSIQELLQLNEGVLEKVYPTRAGTTEAVEPISWDKRSIAVCKHKVARPKAVIPVFPGTNCEYDTAQACLRAGIEPEIIVIRNLSTDLLAQSAQALEKAIRKAQILFLPGGFSGGDEPDGSAKFICSFLRNPRLTDAVHDLLKKRDGLMLGICNGFQALIKLGLVPYGEIRDMDDKCPTLTYNTIGRHQSRYVTTRVASVQSPWMLKSSVGDLHTIPVSHGEGRFVAPRAEVKRLIAAGQIATQYVGADGKPSMDIDANPNGSLEAIEGIFSPDGRVFGKMGHSERRGPYVGVNIPGDKHQPLFESGAEYFR